MIAQDALAIGAAAADRLQRRLDGDERAAGPEAIPTRLIPRGSGEIAAPDA